MKSVLQDLNFSQLEELVLEYGEKKYRTQQIYLGLMQGKKISELPVSSVLRERLLES